MYHFLVIYETHRLRRSLRVRYSAVPIRTIGIVPRPKIPCACGHDRDLLEYLALRYPTLNLQQLLELKIQLLARNIVDSISLLFAHLHIRFQKHVLSMKIQTLFLPV